MIAASGGVINFTGLAGGYSGERTGQAALMAAPSFESSPSTSPWSLCSTASNRSYRSAAVRAAVIAMVLLGVLAVIVLL